MKERARIMRKNMTVAEKYLRKTYLQHCGKTVQRQKIIDHFIVDFYIAQHRLAIEVDGRTHDTADAKEYDNYRTKILEQYNVRIIRFSNEQVLYNLDQVVQQLKAVYSLPPL
ncbi:MAG: endonuclease domain-containing protein [bacterium]|nr:endonuclease domain-containing protein [bacterium]